MEHLWSPWRIQYILKKGAKGCVFCEAFAADPTKDKEYLILHRGTYSAVVMNMFPYNNGHLMVIPYSHQETLEGLPLEAMTEVMTLMNKCVSVLRTSMNAEGFNIGINLGKVAGAGISDHVHVHILPRWAGDTNFITTLGGTRCIPESLQESYEKIRAAWDSGSTQT